MSLKFKSIIDTTAGLLKKSLQSIHYLYMSPIIFAFNQYKTLQLRSATMTDLLEQKSSTSEEKLDSDFESMSEGEIDCTIPIEEIPNNENKFRHTFEFKKSCYKQIIGPNGETLKKLCERTKTNIIVSKKKKHVVIIGAVQKRIFYARHKIDKLINNSKEKLQFTHFISIPTNSDSIKNSLLDFKETVLDSCDTESTGLHEGMFQKPEKLHLTVCMLHLLNESEEEKAIKVLNDIKENLISPLLADHGEPIILKFKGLKCMQNNHAKARTLYIDVHEESGLLKQMCETITEIYLGKELTTKEHDSITLHMTVINTTYMRNNKKHRSRRNFDATDLLKMHSDTNLGQIDLSTFHLSKLKRTSSNGYFEAAAKINV